MTPIDAFETPIQRAYCLACQRVFELDERGLGSCRCRRSRARLVEGVLEIQGPAKALTPLETIVRADGGEWAIVPEGIVVRRVLPPAA